MQRTLKFLQTHRHAIIWTICYILFMWAILYFMFNFDLFSLPQWHHLLRAELHGFAGFVFGIMILAMVPLYIATMTIIIRTKSALINTSWIRIPKFMKKSSDTAPVAPSVDTSESDTPSLPTPPSASPSDIPSDIPAELRTAYLRIQHNLGRQQTSALNMPTAATLSPTSDQSHISPESDALPLPVDFDLDISDTVPTFSDIPTFSEINFDSAPDDTLPQPDQVVPPITWDTSAVTQYLSTNGISYSVMDDLILTDTHVIATHTSPEFWVTDTDNWFASGAVRPSPIKRLKSISESENLTPVLYLAATNIMDLEKLQPEWESSGIRIITSVSDL